MDDGSTKDSPWRRRVDPPTPAQHRAPRGRAIVTGLSAGAFFTLCTAIAVTEPTADDLTARLEERAFCTELRSTLKELGVPQAEPWPDDDGGAAPDPQTCTGASPP